MDLVLSKPSIASDLSVKSEKLRVSKSDEMKYVVKCRLWYAATD